jgi:3-oxoacyl-[acyl-carrier protein] reductase
MHRRELINVKALTTFAPAFNDQNRIERELEDKKLRPIEIAHAISSTLEMDDRGFINELNVWATNPF